jgi:DNA gyrase subunit A
LTDTPTNPPEDIEPIEIQTEMEQSFLEYAMSVIISRALPDARDGLKPVHRRILWSMFDSGHRPDRSHVKCATVVGDVIGKYHPHGDSAIYDSLVRMGQSFSLRHTLIDPHGNFGSPDDPPAAYRYTECRLTPLAMQLLADIDEDTVDFADNFDGKFSEPTVLPSRFPNLLVNGSQGIAVGMATNIPPHNLGEVVDAAIHLIDNPEAGSDELMEFVKGPDFPTAAQILGKVGIRDAYRTGKGSVRMRAVAEIVETKTGGSQIVVTEVPYQTSVDQIARKTAELVERGDVGGIREIRNESAKGETRLVFELKRDANALVVLNNLYKYTPMQSTFSVNMVALVDGVPRTLNLRDALVAYVEHQVEVVQRRSRYRLERAKARAHILDGLIKALNVIDEIIATIRASEDRADARGRLMAEPFEFSEAQAEHILDMQLGRLTRLARIDLETELADKQEQIEGLEAILADPVLLNQVIKDEMRAIATEFATPRLTQLVNDPGELDIEDLIDDDDLVVTLSSSGYIKSVAAEEFRTQGRGGRGVTGAKLKDDDDDLVTHLLHTTAHAYLLFFSNRGKVYRLKAHEIPVTSRTSRGTALVNLLMLEPEERIQAIIDTRDYETNRYLFFATRKGRVKKTLFTAYDSSLKAGLIAINLRDGDELVQVVPTDGEDDIFLTSRRGQAIRFSEEDVRAMGRTAAGVVGMKFRGDDHLVSCDVLEPDAEFLVITSEGYGKRTDPEAFGRKGRAGLGMRCIRVNAKKGEVVGAMFVTPTDEILLISHNGVVIRTAVSDISVQGRDASGVTVMSLADGDHVSAVARLLEVDEDEVDEAEAVADDAIEEAAVESPTTESEAGENGTVLDETVSDETGDED